MAEARQILEIGKIKHRGVKVHQQTDLIEKTAAHFVQIAVFVNLTRDIIKHYQIIGLQDMHCIPPLQADIFCSFWKKQIKKDKGALQNAKHLCSTELF